MSSDCSSYLIALCHTRFRLHSKLHLLYFISPSLIFSNEICPIGVRGRLGGPEHLLRVREKPNKQHCGFVIERSTNYNCRNVIETGRRQKTQTHVEKA